MNFHYVVPPAHPVNTVNFGMKLGYTYPKVLIP